MNHQSGRSKGLRQIAAALLVVVLATLACSLQPRTASLTIINNSSQPICTVFFSEPGTGAWGDDQLGSDNQITAGSSTTISEITPGTYDLRVETCDGNSAERLNEKLDGEVEWTITD